MFYIISFLILTVLAVIAFAAVLILSIHHMAMLIRKENPMRITRIKDSVILCSGGSLNIGLITISQLQIHTPNYR